MFEIGDKVRVKSTEELRKIYKTDKYDLVEVMFFHSDQEGIIIERLEDVILGDEKLGVYKLNFDKGFWTWYSNLIEKA